MDGAQFENYRYIFKQKNFCGHMTWASAQLCALVEPVLIVVISFWQLEISFTCRKYNNAVNFSWTKEVRPCEILLYMFIYNQQNESTK